MDHSQRRASRTLLLGTSCLVTAAIMVSAPARAGGLPSGGTVVAGGATITSPNSTSTIINQTTDKAILTWQDFSIASGNSVTFNQPGSSSIALNRVLGTTPSTINGDLFANGHVWLINGNGILFGKGSQVNVGSLIATTADIDNQDFLNGNYKFGSASGNPNAGIFNDGSIHAANGGSIILAGPVVSNNGIIQADLGNITLGGVSTFSVDFQGDNLLRFQVGSPVQQTPVNADGHPVKALVSNTGKISARGGRVLMTTRAAESVVNNVINNTGMVEATSVSVKDGEIVLDAGDGTVELGGTVDASGKAPGETGGSVTVEGKTVVVADGARIDVSGDQGGGTVRIGGDTHGQGTIPNAQTTTVGRATIVADAISNGDGGKVVIWSDEQTQFAGTVSARGGEQGGDGGFVETSGKHLALATTAMVDTLAPKGKTGSWLLDPYNVVVQSGGESGLHDGVLGLNDDPDSTDIIDPATITGALSSTNVTIEAQNDIIVVDDLIYSSTHALSLLAQHDIDIFAKVQNVLASGGGAINLVAGWDGETAVCDVTSTPGAYGNNSGNVYVGGEGADGDSVVGGASGLTTVVGDRVIVDATNGNAQIGFHGAGGGDIDVFAETLALAGGNGRVAQIGNGSFGDDISGAVTGDIDVRIADQTFFLSGSNGGRPWIGNFNGSGDGSTGDVIVVTGNFNDDNDGNGLGDMVFADLNGGNVTVGETGDNLTIDHDFLYNSTHDLTLLSSGNVVIAGRVQNVGSGSLTAVGGWDGTTTDAAHLTDAGVYGNNGGGFQLVGDEGGNDAMFGSKSGTTTVAASDIIFYNPSGIAQLGYHGHGSGDINVFALTDLTLYGGDAANHFAMIGNGSLNGDVSSNVSGDINVEVGGLTTFAFGGEQGSGGLAWLGNVSGGDGKASGHVSLLTGQISTYGTDAEGDQPNTLGEIITADLGTSADTGGNFTFAVTSPNTDFLDSMLGGGLAYASPHDLTILSSGNLTIANSIQNSGNGALTILAGWNTNVTPADVLTAPGAYGQNGAFVWVVGATGDLADYNPNAEGDHFVDSGMGTSVGSKGGVTTIGGAQVYVEGLSGYAQIGYHGDGGSGAINVIANGVPGEGGLTGVDACFDGNANICVIGGRDGWGDGETPTYAQIGNLGMGVEGTSSANINVSATGNIAVSSGGLYSGDQEDPGIADAYGMIGSGDPTGNAVQNVSGDIDVHAGGQVNFVNSSGANSFTWLGNRTASAGTHSGNVTLIGDSIDGDDMGAMIAYDLGTTSESGGNVLFGVTGLDGLQIDQVNNYSSPHRLSLLSAGDITVGGTLQNSGSGAINLVAGWNGTTTSASHFTDAGVYGNNGGSVIIGGEGADGLAAVGSKSGTVTVAADNVTINALSNDAQLGYHGAGGGEIRVFALDNVNVLSSSEDTIAQIGNGTESADHAGGNIDIHAGTDINVQVAANNSLALIGNQSISSQTGNITLLASDSVHVLSDGDTTGAVIGNVATGGGGTTSGDIDVGAHVVELSANGTQAVAQIGNAGLAQSIDGSIDVHAVNVQLNGNNAGIARIGVTSLAPGATIEGAISVTGEDSLTLVANNSGNAFIGSSADGTINGDIVVMGGEGASLSSANGGQARIGHVASGAVQGDITVDFGDALALTAQSGGVSGIGSNSGTSVEGNIEVWGGALSMSASGAHTTARIGNSSDGYLSGAITVNTGGAIGISAAGGGTAQIGGQSNQTIDGDITVGSGDTLSVTAGVSGSSGGEAWIGNGASGNIDGDITVTAANTISVLANGNFSSAQIGSRVASSGTLTGDVSVTSLHGAVNLGVAGAQSSAQIGGDALDTVDGNVTVIADDEELGAISVSATGNGSVALVGNSGLPGQESATTNGDTTLHTANGLTLSTSANNSLAQIGNHGVGGGDIDVTGGDVQIIASHGLAQIGNGSLLGDVTGDVSGNISVPGDDLFLFATNATSRASIGNASAGSQSGDISVLASSVGLGATGVASSTIGNVSTGSGGTTSGDISVNTDSLGLSASGSNATAQIGNSGDANTISGAIDIETGGLSLLGDGGGTSRIGASAANGDVTQHITVNADNDVLLSGLNSGAAVIGSNANGMIGGDIVIVGGEGVALTSQGNGTALIGNSANGEIDGDIHVTASDFVALGGTEGGRSTIGSFGGGLVHGDIDVTGDLGITLLASHGGQARIGNGGSGSSEGAIDLESDGLISLSAMGSSNAQVGNSTGSTITGDIIVAGGEGVVISASDEGSTAGVGHGAPGNITGDIDVSSADGAVALTATGGGYASISSGTNGNVDGNISVSAATAVTLSASDAHSLTRIGHGASGAITGNIILSTDGTIDLSADGDGSGALIGSGGGSTIDGDITATGSSGLTLASSGTNSVAQIGNDAASDLTGDIVVSSDGSITLASDAGSTTQIGDGTGGTISGDISVNSGDAISLTAGSPGGQAGRSWIGHGAAGSIDGNIIVSAVNDVTLASNGTGSIALIGSNVVVDGTLTSNVIVESQHGGVNLDAAGTNSSAQIGGVGIDVVNGDVTVTADDEENGSISIVAGGEGAVALIGNGGFPVEAPPSTSGAIAVHTANQLTIEADGDGAYAQVGHHGSGGGDIEVGAHDLLVLGGEGSNTGIAQVGNGSLNDDISGDVTGKIDLRITDSTILNAKGGHAWLGNANGSDGTHLGNVLFVTGTMDDQSAGNELADALMSDLAGGDVTFGLTDASRSANTDNALLYNSSHTFNLLVAGDVNIGSSLLNAGSGAINIVSGWNGTTLDAAHFADTGVFGNGGHGVTIGGNNAPGSAAVGSKSGDTTILGASLTLSAVHGYAQLGYHGAGSGNINVNVLGDVDLMGGGSSGFYAQVGNGGAQTNGDNSGDIDIVAGGDVTLTGGAGNEAYVQVGHGGAESNGEAPKDYSNAGTISVEGQNVTLAAGGGDAAYVQIGNGGFKVGAGVTGTSDNSGDITVSAAHAVALTGNGNDAYAQIGNGGNQLNTNAGASAIGTISGNIVVQAESPDDGSVTMTGGGGTHSYVLIGNGGYSINAPTTAPAANFTISGNVSVSDLALTGGDGDYGYAQIGNGDASHTGNGNVSGDIFIQSGDITLTNGHGAHSGASIHNATGQGEVSGNVEGFEEGGDINGNPETLGTLVVLSNNNPPPVPPKTDVLPDVILSGEGDVITPPSTDQTVNPIEQMAGGDGDEKPSDQAADQVGNSLNGGKKTNGQVILGGILKQQGQGSQSTKPHSVPTSDEDYSSWGNEALWQ